MARLGSSQPIELCETLDQLAEGFDLSSFGSAPTKFDVEDLYPITARYLHAQPLSAVAAQVAEIGVPDDLAETFWTVARANITTRHDIAGWWQLFRDGATPLVDDEDRVFVEQAFAMLPEPPYSAETWKTWTEAVKEATGRKGKGLFMPLRKAVTGLERGPEMADVMQLLQKKPAL
jgi:glutamyl-tRNA synthetase